MTISLSGVFNNIEHSIIEAIHLLGRTSQYGDESCRCKDIFSVVKNSTILVDGKPQQGNHRFTIFSSALCGRRSSLRLFQRVNDKERLGSWWKLKVKYEEALLIAKSLHPQNQDRYFEDDQFEETQKALANRDEIVRSKFLSLIPLSMIADEAHEKKESLIEQHEELVKKLKLMKESVPKEILKAFEQMIRKENN